ncbi:acyltransferase [Actinomadura sp. 6K520]|uniref:acyltransferase family protein n=1 Tax=Actinomadura sp. 6K520 TaxID=2530364 RepID=UPI0010512289|nr:acyltransferase [Actinomadura sp. 6K520]TDE33851.1 acyltransferase [Actinomadura sp. 6K520]
MTEAAGGAARTPARGLRGLAENTPPYRERWADLLRAVAILLVITGHWLAAVVTYDRGGLHGVHVLEVLPWARWLSWIFQVMPVFFLVGGFANAASLRSARERGAGRRDWLLSRTDRLLRPTTVFLVVMAATAMAAHALGADPELIGLGLWLARIPLWFLAVYVGVVVLAPVMYALHRRWGLAVPLVLAVLAGAGDVARLGFDLPHGGSANFVLVWLAVHQLGFAWQDGRLPARWTTAAPLLAGGLCGLILLTLLGPYPISMVAVPGAEVQNTSPPTVALLSLAIAQTGVVLLLRDRADRWLRRTRVWMTVVGVNAVILTAFLWHMTAVVVAAAVLYPTGVFPQPPITTAEWVLLRLPWLAFLAAVLAVLMALFGWVEWRGRFRPARTKAFSRDGARGRTSTALTVAGLGGALSGLIGVTLAGQDFHAPAGLPAPALLVYLGGALILHLAQRRR